MQAPPPSNALREAFVVEPLTEATAAAKQDDTRVFDRAPQFFGLASFLALDQDDSDDEEANGAEANGEESNDAEANGTETNDAEANGTETNDAEANGTETNDAETNEAEASGEEANQTADPVVGHLGDLQIYKGQGPSEEGDTQTGADNTQTGADNTQTGADNTQTGADNTQIGADNSSGWGTTTAEPAADNSSGWGTTATEPAPDNSSGWGTTATEPAPDNSSGWGTTATEPAPDNSSGWGTTATEPAPDTGFTPDVDNSQQQTPANVQAGVGRANPNAEDRFRGITYLQSVRSPIPKPAPDDILQVGHMLPPKREKGPKGERRPKEPLPDFASAYARDAFFYDKAQAKAARQAEEEQRPQGSGDAAESSWDRSAAAGEVQQTTSARLKVYSAAHDYRRHLSLTLTFTWSDPESGEKQVSQAELRLPGGSTVVVKHGPLEQFLGPQHDYNDEIQRNVVYTGEGSYLVVIDYRPEDSREDVWCTNILTPGNFGPFQPQIDRLRSFAAHGARIELCLSNASSLPVLLEEVIPLMQYDYGVDPSKHFWAGHHKDIIPVYKNINDPTELTSTVGVSRVSYRNMLELLTFEMVGVKRDHEWQLANLTTFKGQQSVRFLRPPGAANDNALILLVDEDPEAPLGLQDGDQVSLRIHALNPNNNPEHNWKGTVEAGLPHFNGTDRIMMAFRSFDKDDQKFLGKDIGALGDIPGIADITGAASADALIEQQPPRAVDIAITVDSKTFKRCCKTIRAALEQVERERRADPRGVSVLEDVLLNNRFDRLPVLDVLGGVQPEVLRLLNNRLSASQQALVVHMRHALGGFVCTQGCAGAGKTHTLIELLAFLGLDQVLKLTLPSEERAALEYAMQVARGERRTLPPDGATDSQNEPELAQSVAEPGQNEPEPAQSVTEPGQNEPEPAQSVTEPGQNEPEPAQSAIATEMKAPAFRRGVGALVLTPINNNAEDIAAKFRSVMREIGVDDAVVLRKYSKATTKKLSLRHANERHNDPKVRPFARFDLDAAWKELKGAAESATQLFREFSSRRKVPFPADRRVSEEGLLHSPSEYLLMAADVIPTPDELHSAVARVRAAIPVTLLTALTDAYNTYTEVEEVGDSVKASVSIAIRRALDFVYNCADVIVTTPQQAMDPNLWLGFRPQIIVEEEAGKMSSPEGIVFVWYPCCKLRFLVGDPLQSKPQVRSPVSASTFGPQLELGPFRRLILGGFPVAGLYDVHRYNERIKNFVDDNFYRAGLTVAPGAAAGLDARAAVFSEWARSSLGLSEYNHNVLLVNVKNSREESLVVGGSKLNRDTAAMAWAIIASLEASGHYEPADIGIVSPYTGARTLHEGIANRRALAMGQPPGNNAGYMIETAERAQSRQRRILLVEFPNTDRLGFVNQITRLCTGLTRVADGLIIVADVNALESLQGYQKRPLSRVINWCKDRGLDYYIEGVGDDHPIRTYMPSLTKREVRLEPIDIVPERVGRLGDFGDADATGDPEGVGWEIGWPEGAGVESGSVAVGGEGESSGEDVDDPAERTSQYSAGSYFIDEELDRIQLV